MFDLKISVIIPIYNSEKTLTDCLTSVLNQTYENYEVIAVDNSSTDSSKEIIKQFMKKNKKIKYFFEEKKGRGAARNCGIKNSTGEIIVMTDSDCIVPENWIEKLTKLIREGKEIACMGSEKETIKSFWTKNIQEQNSNLIKESLHREYTTHLDTKNFSIRSDIVKSLMFNSNLKALEDFEFKLRFQKIGKIRFIKNLKVKHSHRNSLKSFIKNNFERAFWNAIIYKKYKGEGEIMFRGMSIKSFMGFPIWIIFNFINKPFDKALFISIQELVWKIGNLCGLLSFTLV